jgi:hypothetical protein
MRFSNFTFPAPPSGLFTKLKKKQKHFEGLLRTVLDLAKTQVDLRSSLLKILYRFIFNGDFHWLLVEGCAVVKQADKKSASILETNSSPKDKPLVKEEATVKGRTRRNSELSVFTQSPLFKDEMSLSFTEKFKQPLLEHEETKVTPIPIESPPKEVAPIVVMEDHGKGAYSLGYMEVKMKSNAQWTQLYANIFKGCLLFYKSFKVHLTTYHRQTIMSLITFFIRQKPR